MVSKSDSKRGKSVAKKIMIQGTMSNVGKSLITAGLCRVFAEDGYKAAPFKSQNMALNSFVTADGFEMGRAQVMQAEAARIRPDVCMNPILLKPTGDALSQVIVNGRPVGNMSARDYFKYKKKLIPDIQGAFARLEKQADIIVIEGAGSPAEINLKDDDIVNMGLAKMLNAPVLLVGDINPGGVFAQLLGTLMLLERDERELVKGLIINKFRGDKSILDPGITMLEERSKIPVCGVIPYTRLSLDDEDSLSERLYNGGAGDIDIAVIRFKRISNFTDMDVFCDIDGVSVRYVDKADKLGEPDMIILPGSKNTIDDLKWLRESGLEEKIKNYANSGPVFGICGGFQMLGDEISDPDSVEGGGSIQGMGLLPVKTRLLADKTLKQVRGRLGDVTGIFSELSNLRYEGYEIHAGRTRLRDGGKMPTVLGNGNVYGTYIHSIFDERQIVDAVVAALAKRKGIQLCTAVKGRAQVKEEEYDRLAEVIRESMDMRAIYNMMEIYN